MSFKGKFFSLITLAVTIFALTVFVSAQESSRIRCSDTACKTKVNPANAAAKVNTAKEACADMAAIKCLCVPCAELS